MSDEDFLGIAEAILDGSPVDWAAIGNSGLDHEQPFLAQLCALGRIADVHRRSLDETPASWGPFAIIERIGSGTFGDVYRAFDPSLDRDVALKLLRSPATDRHATEGRLLARVRHPNIVTVHGAAQHDGISGIWMEFVQGQTLAQLLERGPFAPADVLAIGLDLCRALQAVHGTGLLHGDIKAQNVMREQRGRIVLMDFGTGRIAADDAFASGLAGTPLYVAPEVLDGCAPDASSDVYSLGVLLYFLLTGAFPVEGRTLAEIRSGHATSRRILVRDRRRDIPRRLAAIVDRAAASSRAKRFRTAAELEAAMAAAGLPAHRRYGPALAAAAIVVAVLATATWRLRTPAISPEQLRIEMTRQGVTAFDPSGAVRWRHAFDRAYQMDPADQMMNPPWRVVPGPNPAVFAAFSIRTRQSDLFVESGALLSLDAGTGRARQSFSFDDEVTIDRVKYGPPWAVTTFAVDDRPGHRRVAVTAHHYEWDASLVTILDESFHRHGTYVQAGWIEEVYWLASDRLLIGGFNNAHDGGTVALLDPNHLDGQAPEPPGSHYYCESCAAGTPLRVVVMPRTELNRVTKSRFNRAAVQLLGSRIVARTIEVPDYPSSAEAADALYDFTPSLDLIRASFSVRYWELHDALHAQGKVTHNRDDCPDRNGPREILVWDARDPGWKRVPAASAHDGT